MQIQVHPVHFQDFSGEQFERLCFAYLLRRPEYKDVDWYGQLGQDRGRDIVCHDVDGSTHIFQCANYQKLVAAKASEDLQKLASGSLSTGASFHLIVGGSVSGSMKDKVSALATAAGFRACKTWGGTEFEERLRRDAPDLLLRFTEGVAFPELPHQIAAFSAHANTLSDDLIIAGLTVAFDRPAYRTPFHYESSLPRFRKAIAETIETLNTGRTLSGRVMPSKNDIIDVSKRNDVDELVRCLVSLRSSFELLLRKGEMKPCGCGKDDCPTFMMTEVAVQEMDHRRRIMLDKVRELNPDFNSSFYVVD